MFKKISKPKNLLILSLLVILVSSFSASMVQNSFFKVKVTNISFETANGELAGTLYMPRDVDSDNPAPTVILTHGYLNNKEMQEIGAIELSKRGYVVLAFDMYDHGDSVWETPGQFSFFNPSIYDAVQYMYDQDYVLKDADGNGMIGVSGHSMGGFSATAAVVYDEYDFNETGIRKIATMLSVGSDLRYIWIGDPLASMGPRVTGIIAAHYDQFFFDNVTDIEGAPVNEGSVRYKDFVKDPVGLAFLGRTTEGFAEAGVYYDVDGGSRVIYTPDETHPQNTWSLETGRNTIEFFETAFEMQLDQSSLGNLESFGISVGSTSQSWWAKEAFTLIATIGLVLFMVALFPLLSGLPIFNKVNMKLEETTGFKVKSKEKNIVKVIVAILATLISANYIRIFMERTEEMADLAQ
ncbi:MAG: alpha/beta hydrolase, partial [Candidatus Izemoplasma sp.]